LQFNQKQWSKKNEPKDKKTYMSAFERGRKKRAKSIKAILK